MHPIQQLEQLAEQYRHLQAEHERKQPESRARRREHGRLEQTEEQFHRLLEHWIRDADEREAWHEHFYRGDTKPNPSLGDAPLFRGRSDTGSIVEVRHGAADELNVIIDGATEARLPDGFGFALSTRMAGTEFEETFDAPQAALDALLAFVRAPSSEVPWTHARELFADGLIDENFSLTARGQRFTRRASAA